MASWPTWRPAPDYVAKSDEGIVSWYGCYVWYVSANYAERRIVLQSLLPLPLGLSKMMEVWDSYTWFVPMTFFDDTVQTHKGLTDRQL